MDRDDTLAADTVPARSGPAPAGAAGTERYAFGDVIGRGGMGEVVSARDAQIGRTVAIKRLHDASPDAVARFLREAQVQGRLEHPAVVPVHELSHDARGPFFVMKQLAGVTLADVVARLAAGDAATATQFTRQRLLRAFAEVCLAIEFAHAKGVIHRDLKPANIVLGEFGEVYVLDWGIARVLGDAADGAGHGLAGLDAGDTQAGAILGTPGYMSPEQVTGDAALDGRADVYALGCMLFEILALAPLHPRGTAGLVSAIAEIDARPSRIASEIPPELDAACVAAVAPRDVRTASARALGDAVQRFLDGDRDVELRRQLARDELATARAALAQQDSRAAMQAATRALALDPASREPAELVGRLMLEPPPVAPPEVEAELERFDLDAVEKARPLMAMTAVAYLVGSALLYWVGFRDVPYFVGSTLVCLGMVALGTYGHGRIVVLAAVIGNLALLGWLARLVSPFLITPALGAILVMAAAAHPRYIAIRLVVPLAIATMLVPYALERLDVLHSTVAIVGGTVQLQTSAAALAPGPTLATLAWLLAMMFTTAGMFAAGDARVRRAAQRAVQIQKWQLRQLVPS